MPKTNHVLSPEIISRLNNLSLKARYIVEGFMVGLHKSPYHGFSVEFSEHRAYGAGDEIRHIDWKLWGKTDRYFVKQYEEETNLHSYIILDTSRSMEYKSGNVSKLEYGNYLAAALSYLMINQQDGVGLVLFDNKIQKFLPPRSKPSQINAILTHLDNVGPGEDTDVGIVLHEMAERIKKRGLVILISDLLDDPDTIISGLKHFRHNKQEMIVFHIMDRKELKFNFSDLPWFCGYLFPRFHILEPGTIIKIKF